jgi:hypothetical protein
MKSVTDTPSEDREARNKKIHLIVFAPRFPDKPKKFVWELTTLIGAAADEAADKFGYPQGTVSFAKGGIALRRELSLGDAGLNDGDEVELVDVGGGV